MKQYEHLETGRRFMPLLPVYARIDGRSFSRFTAKMRRPYDEDMCLAMQETTKWLISETHALIGYTQSDEISLVWCQEDYESDMFFDGKIFKMASVLASMASAKFGQIAMNLWPDLTRKMPPCFDCRAFQLPNQTEAANAILWREQDAAKNAVSMAARAYFSHNTLHKKTGPEMQEMLFQNHGINFNDYPAHFKRGSFFRRETVERELTPEQLAKIPEDRRPEGPVLRSVINRIDMPIFSKVTNRTGVIFNKENPIVAQ